MRNITPKTVEYGRTMIPPRRNSAPRRIYPSLTSEGIRPSGDQFSYISTPTCVSCSWTVWSAPAWQGSGPIPTAIRSGAASTIPKEFLVDVQARIRAVSFLPECEKIPQTGLISSPPGAGISIENGSHLPFKYTCSCVLCKGPFHAGRHRHRTQSSLQWNHQNTQD
jgi:hypothetical protein